MGEYEFILERIETTLECLEPLQQAVVENIALLSHYEEAYKGKPLPIKDLAIETIKRTTHNMIEFSKAIEMKALVPTLLHLIKKFGFSEKDLDVLTLIRFFQALGELRLSAGYNVDVLYKIFREFLGEKHIKDTIVYKSLERIKAKLESAHRPLVN